MCKLYHDFRAFLAKCDVTWTNNYNSTGLKGSIVKGKGAYSSNSVFFPAAGNYDSGSVEGFGEFGLYWSSSPNDDDMASGMYLYSGGKGVDPYYRDYGYSVRAVLAE